MSKLSSYQVSEVKLREIHRKKLQKVRYNFSVHDVNIGLNIAIGLLIFTLLGIKLDEYFKVKPLFTIIGIIIGCCQMLLYLVKLAKESK